MKIRTKIILFILPFLILGCKSEGDVFKPETNLGYGYFKCKINGEEFVAATDVPVTSERGGSLFFGGYGGGTSIPSAAYAAHISYRNTYGIIADSYGIIGERKISKEPQQKKIWIAMKNEVKVGRYSTTTGEVTFGHSFYADTNGYTYSVQHITDSLHFGWLQITEYKNGSNIAGRFGFSGIANTYINGQLNIKTVEVTEGLFSVNSFID